MTLTVDVAISNGRNNFNLMRLLAAWLVIYSHSWAITGSVGVDVISAITLIKSGGALAVDVFFLISGFLVAASFQRNTLREFVLARVLRIYPALIVCVLLSVFLLGTLLTTSPEYWDDSKTWRYLWSNASLWRAQFWLPGVFDELPRTAVNGSLWTLPIEAHLYVALMAAGLVGMLAPKRYLVAWAIVVAGACTFVYLQAPLPEHLVYLFWATIFFITGMLIWILRMHVRLSGRALLSMLALAAATRGSQWFIPAYFVLVAYGTFWLAFIPRLPVIERADLSYGLYLYGWPMQQLALLGGATTVVENTIVASVMACFFAACSWYLVERPALAWKRQLLAKRVPR